MFSFFVEIYYKMALNMINHFETIPMKQIVQRGIINEARDQFRIMFGINDTICYYV